MSPSPTYFVSNAINDLPPITVLLAIKASRFRMMLLSSVKLPDRSD